MANFKSYFYNSLDFYHLPGQFTWTKPSDIDTEKPILVHVWGAGGGGDDKYSAGNVGTRGGGGGGLAVKMIDVASLGATETITIGDHALTTAQAGSSSFGAHCSATGGNGGANGDENVGSGTTAADNYGIGGKGVGGDINRRGGRGGAGYYAAAADAGGGGGGSAPAPYGVSDGFDGGTAIKFAGGGGGGIGSAGAVGNYCGGAGGSSMSQVPPRSQATNGNYGQGIGNPGASGIFGAGAGAATGKAGWVTQTGNTGKGGELAFSDDNQTFVLTPNQIYFGGGSGAGGINQLQTTGTQTAQNSGGGPGAGGGGSGHKTTNAYMCGGNGGILGGGGGTNGYARGGSGGNAGGGGASGYYQYTDPRNNGGYGLVIVQYARTFETP